MLTCNKIIDETHDVKTFIFNLVSPRSYLAGQHINFSIDINGQEKMCCYTLSSSPTNISFISLTIKRVLGGVVSNYFHDHFKVGDTIKPKAPSGAFHLPDLMPKNILLISAGSGITPMLSMLRFIVIKNSQGAHKNEKIVFVHSAKTEQDLIAKNEIETLIKQHGNGEIIYTLSQQSTSAMHRSSTLKVNHGRLSQTMLSDIEQIDQYEVYVCGPSEFRKSAQQALKNLGLPRSNYHYESFGERRVIPTAVEKSTRVPSSIAPLNESVCTPATEITQTTSDKLNITFDKWGKTFEDNSLSSDSPLTILEQGEAAGLILPYSCRGGMCGNCKAKLIKGDVKQLSTDGLSQEELQQGYILCCSAIAQSDVNISHV